MATDKSVNCANRNNDWDILWIGWYGFYHTKNNAITFIEAWLYNYYVNWITKVIVKNWTSWKYLTTIADNTTSNNLDEIKSCSL